MTELDLVCKKDIENEAVNILDELPRNEGRNPLNLSRIELQKRNKQIQLAIKDYPRVPEMWVEWMYDYIQKEGEDKIKEMIDNGDFDRPDYVKRELGGILKTGEIINKNVLLE